MYVCTYFMYRCLACMYACAACEGLVPVGAQKRVLDPLGMESEIVVSFHKHAGNQILLCLKSIQCLFFFETTDASAHPLNIQFILISLVDSLKLPN